MLRAALGRPNTHAARCWEAVNQLQGVQACRCSRWRRHLGDDAKLGPCAPAADLAKSQGRCSTFQLMVAPAKMWRAGLGGPVPGMSIPYSTSIPQPAVATCRLPLHPLLLAPNSCGPGRQCTTTMHCAGNLITSLPQLAYHRSLPQAPVATSPPWKDVCRCMLTGRQQQTHSQGKRSGRHDGKQVVGWATESRHTVKKVVASC